MEGTVKSFNEVKGWGFIEVEDQGDIFFHIKDCEGGTPQVGDVLSFEAEESATKPGSLKAKNVVGGTGPPSTGKGAGGHGATAVTGSHKGTVKSFNEAKGWGFIVDEETGQDVFVHIKDCGGAQPNTGDYVGFEVQENPDKPGSIKARSVTGCTGQPAMGGKAGAPWAFGKGKGGGCDGYGMWGAGAWGKGGGMVAYSPYGFSPYGCLGGPYGGFAPPMGYACGKGKATW